MLTAIQKQEVSNQVNTLISKANDDLGSNIKNVDIQYTLRGTSAGTARGDFELNFNPMLMINNWEEYKRDTIIHEVAHIVDFNIHGEQHTFTRSGPRRITHGTTWKSIMRRLGGNPTRCHQMDVSKITRKSKTSKTYTYICSGCGAEVKLSATKHNRARSHKQRYFHRTTTCRGSALVLKSEYNNDVPIAIPTIKPTAKASKIVVTPLGEFTTQADAWRAMGAKNGSNLRKLFKTNPSKYYIK